jgi:hypothetical protein
MPAEAFLAASMAQCKQTCAISPESAGAQTTTGTQKVSGEVTIACGQGFASSVKYSTSVSSEKLEFPVREPMVCLKTFCMGFLLRLNFGVFFAFFSVRLTHIRPLGFRGRFGLSAAPMPQLRQQEQQVF